MKTTLGLQETVDQSQTLQHCFHRLKVEKLPASVSGQISLADWPHCIPVHVWLHRVGIFALTANIEHCLFAVYT